MNKHLSTCVSQSTHPHQFIATLDQRATRSVTDLMSASTLMLTLMLMLITPPLHAQGLPTCRVDMPLVLQPSTCLPDRHAMENAQAASAAAAAAAASAAHAPKKTLTEVLRAREEGGPDRHFGQEWLPDGSKVLKPRMGSL